MASSALEQATELIDRRPVSRLQKMIFFICFLIIAIDGFDTTVIGFLAPAITPEWNLSAAAFGAVFGMSAAGAMIGAFIFGPIGDRIGRKLTFICTIAVFSLASIASGWSQNIETLVIWRFVAGLGLGGALPCATAITSEYSPLAKRSFIVTAMFCGFAIGAASGGAVSAMALPTIGWRTILIAGGLVPLLLLPVIWWLLPESLAFLIYRGGQDSKVKSILNRIAPGADIDLSTPVTGARRQSARLGDIFRERPVMGSLIAWSVSYLLLLIIGLMSIWLPTFLSGTGYSLKTASYITVSFHIASIGGALLIGRFMDKFSANRILAFAFLASCFCIAMIAVGVDTLVVAASGVFATGFFLSGGQFGMWPYVAAYYPVNVRVTGVGWSSTSGRAGSITGSFAGGGLLALGLSVSQILLLLIIPAILAAGLILYHGRYFAEAKKSG